METFTHTTYQSPFTWRYGSPEMRGLWSEIHRRKLWRQVWVALAQAQSEVGLVTPDQVAELRAHQDSINITRALELEADLRHDLMAEIRTYAEQCPIGGGIIHLGATSQDILDTADILRMKSGLALLETRLRRVLGAFVRLIDTWADTPTMAFTHIQPAEPTTVGYRLAMYAQDLLTDFQALIHVQAELRTKGIKGAVGTAASYAALLTDSTPAQLEARFLEILGLAAFPITSQTYPRKQDWQVGNALAGIAGSLYKFGFDLRLLQSPLAGEWAEPFGQKQVGSSAMPFKRNPIKAENLDSLGRWVAAQTQVLWDNAAHSLLERTLDDSANRRSVLPEIFLAVDEMLSQTEKLLDGLVIHTEQIERNLAAYGPFAATEPLLMALVKAGADRQAMHEVLREHSLKAWSAIQRGQPNPLADLIAGDASLRDYLSPDLIQHAFDARAHIGDAPQRARLLMAQISHAL